MRNASIVTGVAVAALSFVSSVRADPVYQNVAGIAQARVAGEEDFIRRSPLGVSNPSAVPRRIVITPPRGASDLPTDRLRVWISITKEVTPTKFDCQVELRDETGDPVISKQTNAVPAGNSGKFNPRATFTAAETAAANGAVVVTCWMPAANKVTIREVRARYI